MIVKKRHDHIPSIAVFDRGPQNLRREVSTNRQKNYQDDTIIYGEDDALPLRIAQAVEDSPAASSCLETYAQFIKGAGFSNPALMDIVIDDAGTTLWQLHCSLADSLSIFWGFSANLKYNKAGKIMQVYQMSFESCRFKKPEEDTPYIDRLVYNPFFGTNEYQKKYSKEYPIWNGKPDDLAVQMAEMKKGFPGQVYYYGRTSPLSRFYPKPKHWSARKWMYIDSKIQESHAENLDNGWFQSVLMNVIGDPNEWSKNPIYQEEYNDASGQKRTRSTKKVGEEFNEMMSAAFSGSKKMGTVMVQWAKNKDLSTDIQAFPATTNADLFLALQDLTTQNITIATRVPSILANISEGVSLGSTGSEIQKAIELMQSNTAMWRKELENFYNVVLRPNMQTPFPDKVRIVNYNPVSEPADLPDKIWDALDAATRKQFIKDNYPGVKFVEPVAAAPDVQVNPDGTTKPVEPAPAINENMRTWSMSDLNKIQKIVARYNLSLSDPENAKALTFDQAKQILQSYGLTDADIDAWIVKPEEI